MRVPLVGIVGAKPSSRAALLALAKGEITVKIEAFAIASNDHASPSSITVRR